MIHAIHADSRGTYGAPRVHAELARSGERTSRKRVARLMREAGLVGVHRRKSACVVARPKRSRCAPDLVERDFSACAPNELWVADITEIPTRVGRAYLAVILDVFSRRIVGRAWGLHATSELVITALERALEARQPKEGVVHH